MPTSTKDGRRLTGYRGDTDTGQSNIGHVQHHSLYDDDMDDYHDYHTSDIEDDVYEEYDEDLDDVQAEDDTGSELSIPDPNIDFDMVYALHTFAATVEGQVSVIRGDALTLLDDSNSYWWLVKVLKTADVGYIPAENIETPHERLARLNSHRNIELTRRDIQDAFPTPPSNKAKNRKRVTLAKGVQFQSQIIYGTSDDEDDFEAEFQQWDEKMRSDDSETDDEDSDQDSDDDPYNYYNDPRGSYMEPVDMYLPYEMNATTPASVASNSSYVTANQQTENAAIVDHYNRMNNDSDIINDPEDQVVHDSNRDTLNLDDETIKISLTPSIARDHNDNRQSDSSIQSKLRKAAKLDKLLNPSSSPEPEQSNINITKEKKEKSGIRKFFSRSNSSSSNTSSSKDKKHKKASSTNGVRRASDASTYETASISSQSTGMMSMDRDRSSSVDSSMLGYSAVASASTAIATTTTTTTTNNTSSTDVQLKIYAGNITDFDSPYKYANVHSYTTALDLIHQLVGQEKEDETTSEAYHDYYLVVRTLGGDEFTLVPSDKPLEIFHSLTAHLSTPMPSLKKARRISQLMGSENAHIGGPTKEGNSEDQVQFFLFFKTKRVEDGEIQIKVSLLPLELESDADQSKRVDKLVKIASSVLVKDAVPLLLEKFHILNGVVAGLNSDDDNIKSLRLDGQDEIVKYQLAINKQGQEHVLDPDQKLLHAFGDQVPPIHYRRNSNPDRSSITVNITPPDKNEIYFILKRVETKTNQQKLQEQQHARPVRPMRQDTPMPRQETTPTDGFQPPIPHYQPQIVIDTHDVMSSPEDTMFNSKPALSTSPDSNEDDVISQLNEAIDTLTLTASSPLPSPSPSPLSLVSPVTPVRQSPSLVQKQRARPESTESMLFCNDFGMNDLMVMIRGAAQLEKPTATTKKTSYQIRTEISEVFKDSQTRLDQLEKELDRIMAEAVKVYPS